MKKSFTEQMEIEEMIQKLRDKGMGSLVDAFLSNEKEMFTRKGRLNKSGACRVLGSKPKDLEQQLLNAREMLESELGSE